MNDNKEWQEINLAINTYLKLGFWHNPTGMETTKKFGQESLDRVEKIYNYATGFNVDWNRDTIENALMKLEKSLKENYENLNNESLETLKRCFSYNWK
jgi:hypothetical protein